MVIRTGGGSNGNPRHAAGTPLQSYRAPTNGRRRKYACDRGASAATVTAKRRVARVPVGTGELMASSRSTLHPTGALNSIPSSVSLASPAFRSEEHTSELQSRFDLVCRLLLEKKNNYQTI